MLNKKNIVIVGRPNVGKSNFFNKFVRKKIANNKAIVYSERGTTIDYKADFSEIFDCELIDTAGLAEDLTFSALCNRQTTLAIEGASICLFMIDGSEGVTAEDIKYARFVRKTRDDLPVILIVNKCDKKSFQDADTSEFYKLGFGEPILISTEQNIGFTDIVAKTNELFRMLEVEEEDDESEEAQAAKDFFINLSIVGRPNVGKSTLLNRLFKHERAIVSPIAGTTRDTISVEVKHGDYTIKLSDTAGIRKKDHDKTQIEKMSINSTMISIQFANIALLLIDGTIGLEKQDLMIGQHVLEEGRGLIILINKWDQVKNKNDLLEDIDRITKKYLAHANLLTISAKEGFNCDKIFPEIINVYNNWKKRITTGKLNRWIRMVLEEHEHKLSTNKRSIKIKFITQYDIRPPRFFVSVNRPDDMDETYKRYIVNKFRRDFGMEGVPIRIEFGSSKNPYYDKEKKVVTKNLKIRKETDIDSN
jgi:GTP-binding protein